MTPARFEGLFELTVDQLRELTVLKGGEYAPGGDRLENFKKNAAALGLEPEVVWAVYAGKHWDAVQTYVRDLATGKERKRSEPIAGRFHDLMVYLLLGLALLEDRNERSQHP